MHKTIHAFASRVKCACKIRYKRLHRVWSVCARNCKRVCCTCEPRSLGVWNVFTQLEKRVGPAFHTRLLYTLHLMGTVLFGLFASYLSCILSCLVPGYFSFILFAQVPHSLSGLLFCVVIPYFTCKLSCLVPCCFCPYFLSSSFQVYLHTFLPTLQTFLHTCILSFLVTWYSFAYRINHFLAFLHTLLPSLSQTFCIHFRLLHC